MFKIESIRRQLEESYKLFRPTADLQAPTALRVTDHIGYANEYIGAASVLAKEGHRFMWPLMQLTGHAVELALKACLLAANKDPGKGHNLEGLYKRASAEGFSLGERDQACIVHLAHLYFKDLATGTGFKARYPAEKMERSGGSIPDHSIFEALVRSLVQQAEQRNQPNLAALGQ